MDNSGYIILGQQRATLRRLDMIANNVANMSTTGFRREDTIFSEYISALDVAGGQISAVNTGAGFTDLSQGAMKRTGNPLDLSIDGDGWFLVETPNGERLTRDGRFLLNDASEVVTKDGFRVLDDGGAPIFIPPDAKAVSIASDGTISANGLPVGQIGIVTADPLTLTREGSTLFASPDNQPSENPKLAQGFLESGNVNPVSEITALIQVQRAYEQARSMLDAEDERILQTIRTLGRQA